MKILLLGFSKIKFMPYANFYLQNINTDKHDVHLLYWNRDTKPEDISKYDRITLHEFKYFQQDNVPHKDKIKGFLKYRKFANSILQKKNFDFVIVLHTMPGILTYSKLVRKFKDRFIFDYRDSTYERYSFFKNMIGKLIKSSKCTFTSSDGFRKFFPESERDKTYTSHNISKDSLSHREFEKNPHDKIRISFWGITRDEALNRKLIDGVSNDGRFELHYYGREQQVTLNLKEYVKEIAAENIFFHGEYVPEERYDFVRNTDIIHNLYNSNNMMLAMGNKYYDGAIFYIPLLCMEGSFMANTAVNAGIGFECDPNDENFTQNVYEYYTSLDRGNFVSNCDMELERTLNEYYVGEEILKKLFG